MYINAGMPMTLDDMNTLRKSLGWAPIISDDSATKVILGVGETPSLPKSESSQAEETLSSFSCGHDHSNETPSINLALNEEQEALKAYWKAPEEEIGKELF